MCHGYITCRFKVDKTCWPKTHVLSFAPPERKIIFKTIFLPSFCS